MGRLLGPLPARSPPRVGACGRREWQAPAAVVLCALVLGCSGAKPGPDPCTDGVPNLRVTITFDPSTCPPAPKDLTAEFGAYIGGDRNKTAVARSGIRSGETLEVELPSTYYGLWARTALWEGEPATEGTESGHSPPQYGDCGCSTTREVRLFCDGPVTEMARELPCDREEYE